MHAFSKHLLPPIMCQMLGAQRRVWSINRWQGFRVYIIPLGPGVAQGTWVYQRLGFWLRDCPTPDSLPFGPLLQEMAPQLLVRTSVVLLSLFPVTFLVSVPADSPWCISSLGLQLPLTWSPCCQLSSPLTSSPAAAFWEDLSQMQIWSHHSPPLKLPIGLSVLSGETKPKPLVRLGKLFVICTLAISPASSLAISPSPIAQAPDKLFSVSHTMPSHLWPRSLYISFLLPAALFSPARLPRSLSLPTPAHPLHFSWDIAFFLVDPHSWPPSVVQDPSCAFCFRGSCPYHTALESSVSHPFPFHSLDIVPGGQGIVQLVYYCRPRAWRLIDAP